MAHWSDDLVNSPGFCTRPFFHLFLGLDGESKVCCYNTEYSYGHLKDKSFNEIMSKDNSALTNFRRQFISSSKLPDSCRSCLDPISNNYRKIHFQHTKHLLKNYNTVEDLINNEKIYTYDVRFSNLCNLACRYCWPLASSRIAASSKSNNNEINSISHDLGLENIQHILDRFEHSIDNVVQFYFAGGEPLIMKEHYQILDLCLKHNRTDIVLSYNTNLTVLGTKKYNLFEYWSKFDNIGINASIDAGWQQFEFIRYGAKWDKVLENLKLIKKLSNVKVTITPVIAFWNMIGFPKLYKYLVENNILNRQFHGFGGAVLDHDYLLPAVLPGEFKDYLRDLYNTEYKDLPELQTLLVHLNDDQSHRLPKTKKYIESLAAKQNCDIYQIFPEFKEIFKNV